MFYNLSLSNLTNCFFNRIRLMLNSKFVINYYSKSSLESDLSKQLDLLSATKFLI
jgi:hypothetical protein